MIDKCQRFVGRNKAVSHGDCVKSSTRTLFPTKTGGLNGHNRTGACKRMGTYLEVGPTGAGIATEKPAVNPGAGGLQGFGQQSVDQAQGSTWVVVVPMDDWYQRAFYATFDTWGDAYNYWYDRPGSLICKNHTPA